MPAITPDGQASLNVVRAGIPSNATILLAKTSLEFKDGSLVDLANSSMYIHHFLTADADKPGILPVAPCEDDPTLGPSSTSHWSEINGVPGSGFVGLGNDYLNSPVYFTTKDGQFDSGYFTGDQDDFVFMLDVVNSSPKNQNIYLVLDLEYKNGRAASDAANQLLTVNGCRREAVSMSESGPTATSSKDFPILVDGNIVHAQGQ